jgi:protein-S-isoprenylcysteine O-methyltransferase Ste14
MASFDASVDLGAFGLADCRRLARRAVSVLSRAGLVALFGFFAWANFAHWRASGEPSGLGITALEGWVALLFLTQRGARELSRRPAAWIAAPIGSFAMLFARPGGDGLPHMFCELVQFSGVAIAFAGLATLGRSFGLVAADRGVKTGGAYQFVRHPAYSGYLISYLGYVAENPTARNMTLLLVSTIFQVVRMNEEERVLVHERAYRSYRRSVRYRLIPFLY